MVLLCMAHLAVRLTVHLSWETVHLTVRFFEIVNLLCALSFVSVPAFGR